MGLGRVSYQQMKHTPVKASPCRSPLCGEGSLPLEKREGRRSCGCSVCGRSNGRADASAPALRPEIPSVDEGCGCGCGQTDGDCAKIKKQLQTVDFALYEVILYLDAYPDSAEALNTYHLLLARRQKLASVYEQTCGPLTAWGNISTTSWDWVKGSAPWEYPKD